MLHDDSDTDRPRQAETGHIAGAGNRQAAALWQPGERAGAAGILGRHEDHHGRCSNHDGAKAVTRFVADIVGLSFVFFCGFVTCWLWRRPSRTEQAALEQAERAAERAEKAEAKFDDCN